MQDYLQGVLIAAKGAPVTLAISFMAVLAGLIVSLIFKPKDKS